MKKLLLPRYVIGEDAFDAIYEVCHFYGNKVGIIHGYNGYPIIENELLQALSKFEIVANEYSLKDVTYANCEKLVSSTNLKDADFIIGVGGGKCLDITKVVAEKLEKPVFTIPTIAAQCGAVTKISVMYNDDGSHLHTYRLKTCPEFTFIDTKVIVKAPVKYLWAGIGDTMAKHIESVFASRNDELDFASNYGITVGKLCYDPIIRFGKKAMDDAKNQVVSEELEEVIQSIVCATGSVSLSVRHDYNGALSHALFYGMTIRKEVEENHLHGEIVSYGSLVQLMVDNQMEALEELYRFHKSIDLPVCLADLGLSRQENIEDILDFTEKNKELNYVPYKITKDMIRTAILKLEDYSLNEN